MEVKINEKEQNMKCRIRRKVRQKKKIMKRNDNQENLSLRKKNV